MLEKVGQRGLRLHPGSGEQPRTVLAEERDPLGGQPVEVVSHLGVDVVLDRPRRLRQPERVLALGRWLTVLGVEVPPPTDRLGAVHQHTQSAPVVPVEVLHQQTPPATALGPGGELGPARAEPPSRQPLDRPLLGQSVHEMHRRPRRRLDHLELIGHLGQPVAVGLGAHVCAPLPQLGRPMTHGRQDQVGLLSVEHAPTQHRSRLDDQHRTVGVVQKVRTQLVPEQPAARHRLLLCVRSQPGHSRAHLP